MRSRRKNSHRPIAFIGLGSLAAYVLLFAGCATPPTPIPVQYTEEDHEMSIEITEIPERGVFRDTGNGGLIGLMVNSGRASTLREKMEGITGNTVESILEQELERNLEEYFYIEDETEELELKVNVMTWGWFLPTAAFGIKAGDYQFEIVGVVDVWDQRIPGKPKDQRVGFFTLRAMEPLGNDPDEKKLRDAMVRCADSFAKQTVDFLLNRQTEADQ